MKFLIGRDYARAMARAHLLQPARASLVDEWIGFIREQYPEQTKDMDIAAFAEGHLKGYSVTAEIFANMAEARRLTRAGLGTDLHPRTGAGGAHAGRLGPGRTGSEVCCLEEDP